MPKSIFSFVASVLILLPLTASAGDGNRYFWFISRYYGDTALDNQITLFHGVPETDDFQFAAYCAIGTHGRQIVATVGTPVEGMAQDQRVQIRFGSDTYERLIDATVVRSDEGVHGVEFPLEADDPLWTALVGPSDLSYNVIGQTGLQLAVQGSGDQVRAFLDDCRRIGEPAPAAAPQPQGKPGLQVDSHGCELFPGLHTLNSNTPQLATFVNRAAGYRVVMWLDSDGQSVEYARLNPGESISINSYLTHPWMITDGPGNCLQIIQLQPGVSEYEIAVPSPDFGLQ